MSDPDSGRLDHSSASEDTTPCFFFPKNKRAHTCPIVHIKTPVHLTQLTLAFLEFCLASFCLCSVATTNCVEFFLLSVLKLCLMNSCKSSSENLSLHPPRPFFTVFTTLALWKLVSFSFKLNSMECYCVSITHR